VPEIVEAEALLRRDLNSHLDAGPEMIGDEDGWRQRDTASFRKKGKTKSVASP